MNELLKLGIHGISYILFLWYLIYSQRTIALFICTIGLFILSSLLRPDYSSQEETDESVVGCD